MARRAVSVRSRRAGLVCVALVTALMVPSAGGQATMLAKVKFGAKLTKNTQPSNAFEGQPCQPDPGKCTRVSMEAYGRPETGHKAPQDGTIGQIRIIAGVPGSFTLQIARAKPGPETAKVIANGPKITYDGQPDDLEPYVIETFDVSVPVSKGDYLAIKAGKTSFMRCSSGGSNQLLFQPPLSPGGDFEPADETDGCWLLLEAVYE